MLYFIMFVLVTFGGLFVFIAISSYLAAKAAPVVDEIRAEHAEFNRRPVAVETCSLTCYENGALNPVHQHLDESWWFYTEGWADEVGPFATEEGAALACNEYAKSLDQPDYDALEKEHMGDYEAKTGIYSEDLCMMHPPFITTTETVSGWKSLLVCWVKEADCGGWYECYQPMQTGMFGYPTKEEAEEDARMWAQAERIPLCLEGTPPMCPDPWSKQVWSWEVSVVYNMLNVYDLSYLQGEGLCGSMCEELDELYAIESAWDRLVGWSVKDQFVNYLHDDEPPF